MITLVITVPTFDPSDEELEVVLSFHLGLKPRKVSV